MAVEPATRGPNDTAFSVKLKADFPLKSPARASDVQKIKRIFLLCIYNRV